MVDIIVDMHLYDAIIWKEQKTKTQTCHDFGGKVMNQIHQYEQQRPKPLFDMNRLTEFISMHPLAKAAMVAAGALTGIIRIAYMIHALFFVG